MCSCVCGEGKVNITARREISNHNLNANSSSRLASSHRRVLDIVPLSCQLEFSLESLTLCFFLCIERACKTQNERRVSLGMLSFDFVAYIIPFSAHSPLLVWYVDGCDGEKWKITTLYRPERRERAGSVRKFSVEVENKAHKFWRSFNGFSNQL